VIPAIPKHLPKDVSKSAPEKPAAETQQYPAPMVEIEQETTETPAPAEEVEAEESKSAAAPINAWATKRSWTAILKPAAATPAEAQNESNKPGVLSIGQPSAESLAEALKSFSVASTESKVAFLKPRGLVNSGNMCYMNSVSPGVISHAMLSNKYLGSPGPRILCSFLQFSRSS
jgi:ubiquitin carboxyl-terminal hydrolase 10